MIIDELFEAPQLCPECGGISFSDLILAEKKDACYYKVKASAKVWPSAYASGRLVQCRKKGAANYGNKSEGVAEGYDMTEQVGWTDDAEKILDKMPLDKRMEWDRAYDSNYSEPWSDVKQNWSYDRPVPGPSVKDNTIRLRDESGKEADYAYDSPQAKQVYADRMKKYGADVNGPVMKALTTAFSKPVDRSKVKTIGQSDSTSDFTDSGLGNEIIPSKVIKPTTTSANTDTDNVDSDKPTRFDMKSMKFVPVDKPAEPTSTKVPDSDVLKPGEEIVPPSNTDSRSMKVTPATNSNSKFVLWDPVKQQPVTQADQKRSAKANAKDSPSIPAKSRPGSWQELARLNNITDPRKLQAGTRIKTPDGGSIYVNKGDTLSGIAQKMRDTGTGNQRIKEGKQEPQLDEVSLGKYREKAMVSQAGAKIKKFFDRDDPAAVAAADRTIAKRQRGLGRADARVKPYTPPSVDMEKQRQELTDKYPNIDELVRRAELNRDPNYEYADGQAYYAGQEAEQKYQRLKQIQRIIQGLNEETRQATLNTPVGDFTADITKDKNTNTVSGKTNIHGVNLSATKDMTPGGAQSVSVDTNVAPNLNLSATRKSADYNKGQLAGTKSVAAKYTDTTGALGEPGQQHTVTRTAGVGFGGASGSRVGKNYVTQIDKTLADYMKEAKNIGPRDPRDLQPLEGPMGGGGGGYTGGPSPFKGWFGGAKPGSREASIAQNNPNTMTVKQGPNPDYRPQTTGDKPKVNVKPGETMDQAVQRTKTQQEFGKFLQGQSGQTFGAGGGRGGQGGPTAAQANTMSNAPVSVKNKPSAMNSMARDLTNPPKSTNTNTTTTNNAPRQNDRVDPLDMPRDPLDIRPGYDGRLGSNPGPNTADKKSSWLGKTAKGLGYAAGAYGAADIGSRALDYYDQTKDQSQDEVIIPDIKETKKREQPEVEYDDDYDAMVARVKRLAGLGPMKTVYDPKKRQYRNMPTAPQPKK